MKSFRQILPAICVILIASAFTGCGADADSPDKRPALEKIEYTNLNDSVSTETFGGYCFPAPGCRETAFRASSTVWTSFNDSVKQEWLTDGL